MMTRLLALSLALLFVMSPAMAWAVNARTGDTKTFAGTGKPGSGDSPAEFHEPAGVTHAKGKVYVADTNNHLIRTIDIATGKVLTLAITGLDAPGKQAVAGQ